MPYPATPRTWVAGDVLTAAQLNAEIRDALLAIFPLGPPDVAWTAFTPTLSQAVTLTKTATYARYTRIGRQIHAQCLLSITSAGTAGNPVLVGLPVPAAVLHNGPAGAFLYQDTGVALYSGVAALTAGSNIAGQAHALGAYIGQAPSFAAANTDLVGYDVTYEAAT